METRKYSRRAFNVEAVRVTAANMDEVADWCQGTIVETPATGTARAERYIQVDVHAPVAERQSRAFAGDFVLKLEGSGSFKVYTTKAFNKNFEAVDGFESESRKKQQRTHKRPANKNSGSARVWVEESPNRPIPTPNNGIRPEAREALAKIGRGMLEDSVKPEVGAALTKIVEKTQDVNETPTEAVDASAHIPPVVEDSTPEIKSDGTKRKFIQKAD